MDNTWFESDLKIAEEHHGIDFLNFKSKEEAESNRTCHKICLWIKDHDYLFPNIESSDETEREYATWIHNKRKLYLKQAKGDLISIGQASKISGVSITTLRRWEKNGLITSIRTNGSHRRYYEMEIRLLVFGKDGIDPILSKIEKSMK